MKTCPCCRDTALGATWACGLGWEARTWYPGCGGWSLGTVPELAQGQNENAVPKLGGGNWEPKWEIVDGVRRTRSRGMMVGWRRCECQGHTYCWLLRMDVMLVEGA